MGTRRGSRAPDLLVANNRIPILTIKASSDIGAKLRLGKPAIDTSHHLRSGVRRRERSADRECPPRRTEHGPLAAEGGQPRGDDRDIPRSPRTELAETASANSPHAPGRSAPALSERLDQVTAITPRAFLGHARSHQIFIDILPIPINGAYASLCVSRAAAQTHKMLI